MRISSKWSSVSVDGGRETFRYLMSGFTAITLGCLSFRYLISSCCAAGGAVAVNTMAGIWGNLDSSSEPIIENSFLNSPPLIIIKNKLFEFQKIIKTFYKPESSREDGTLPHFRTLLGRRNVTGQVKATNGFEAHKDFIFTVTRYMGYSIISKTDSKKSALNFNPLYSDEFSHTDKYIRMGLSTIFIKG